MNILPYEKKLTDELQKEMRITNKRSELVKRGMARRHKIVAYLEDLRMVKSYGLTMEDIL